MVKITPEDKMTEEVTPAEVAATEEVPATLLVKEDAPVEDKKPSKESSVLSGEDDDEGFADLTGYTWEEISKHNKPADCWIVVHDKIYDVTSFAGDHPGGPTVIQQRAGKNATIFFDNAGHSAHALELMKTGHKGKPMLVGKVKVDRGRRYSAPDIVPSDWHEARRAAMLSGRHGEEIMGWMKQKPWKLELCRFLIFYPAHVGLAFYLGYVEMNYLYTILIAIYLGAWFAQAHNQIFHEYSHNVTPLNRDNRFVDFWSYWIGSSILSDFANYYGPLHPVHHKFLGVHGRDLTIPSLKVEYPGKSQFVWCVHFTENVP